MKKVNLTIQINANVEKVWNTVIGEATYREWTAPFNAGSYFRGDWSKGSKMLFLGPDPKTGIEGGMVSEIAENIPQKYISIKHLGIINNGVEDRESAEVKKWTPAFENYTFEEKDTATLFTVELDSNEEFYDYFMQTWPLALEKLKLVCER